MNDHQRPLRDALGNFATGITVITTRCPNGQPKGMTVNSFASVSLEPPLVSWCIGEQASLWELFQESDYFAVNILQAHQQVLSNRFAGSHKDNFDEVPWHEGQHGLPLLTGCNSYFQCQVQHRYPGGDHHIIVGRVLDFSGDTMSPLVFFGGEYHELK